LQHSAAEINPHLWGDASYKAAVADANARSQLALLLLIEKKFAA